MKDDKKEGKGKSADRRPSSSSDTRTGRTSNSDSDTSSGRTSGSTERESSEQANRATSVLRSFWDLITPNNILSILVFFSFEAMGLFMRASHPFLTISLNSAGLATYIPKLQKVFTHYNSKF